jgi:hypothetical protein
MSRGSELIEACPSLSRAHRTILLYELSWVAIVSTRYLSSW